MKQVIVVGAGITGVSCAEWLRRDGWTVTLIDRIRPGDPGQTSYGNAGLLARNAIIPVSVPGLLRKAPGMLLDRDSPLFLRWTYLPRLLPWLVPFLRHGRRDRMEAIVTALNALTSDSVDQHLSLAKGTGAERFIATGEYGFLYRSRADFLDDAESVALRTAHGFEHEERDRSALLERDPHLGPAYNFAAVYKDHGWISDPGGYVAALARHFEASGGTFLAGEVAQLRPGERPAVTLRGGQVIAADKLVIAAGIWSRQLLASAGTRVNLESERGYHLFLKGSSIVPPYPFMVTDAKFVVTPMQAGLRCAGIVEFGGIDAPMSQAPLDLLRRRIREVYPALTYATEAVWMGHRPTLPDSLPMLGEAQGAQGVIFAFGSQHVGLTIGPRLGRLVADLAARRHPNIDLSPYRPGRFAA